MEDKQLVEWCVQCTSRCPSRSVLSPVLFIIVLEALPQEFQSGCPWELLYADDLVIIADTMDELLYKLDLWKKHLEAKGLRVNMEKT